MKTPVRIVWFRRDLRLRDNPALAAACRDAGTLVPLFVLDDALLQGRWASPKRTAFLLGSLAALDEDLQKHGSRLIVRRGDPRETVPALARELGAEAVHAARDYSPYARQRDDAVEARLADDGVGFERHVGQLVAEPEDIASSAGTPYKTFTPFWRAWEQLPLRAICDLPALPELHDPPPSEPLPSLASLRHTPSAADLPAPGERAARKRIRRWLDSGLENYATARDRLDGSGSSRLSQDLRWGLISPVELLSWTGDAPGADAFRRELCWRDFFAHLLWHHPRLLREPYRDEGKAINWRNDPNDIAAWKEGRTGYPAVDAAMRQLAATGWMPNRARMVVASFLTRHLLCDWRIGEAHFMAHLIDGDPASNNGNWQWVASTGVDVQPFFRIFNPVSQGRQIDSDGAYICRWLPELHAVPERYLHAPWTMPSVVQVAAGCHIGDDYPAPIVEHHGARERALAAYRAARR